MPTPDAHLIVVGIDGSTASLAALRWALKEAVIIDAAVDVVHCYLPETLTDLGFSTPHELHAASAIMVENEVSAALRTMPTAPTVYRSSEVGSPATVLVAKANDAHLLVLGAHGRTVIRDLVLGRVGHGCLARSLCPVVIVGSDNSVVRHEPRRARTAAAP